jgi:Phage endonuclease I
MKLKLRNQFEKSVYRQLKRSQISFKYESKKVPYVIAGHYTPDFVLTTPLGEVIIETKGYLRPEDKRKLIAVKRCNPRLDIRLLFYENRPKQIKWAERNGFRYAIEKVPRDWLNGL